MMFVDMIFCKLTDSNFGRKIMCKKGTSRTRISIYSSKDKALSFPGRKWANVVNMTPGCWLVILRNAAIFREGAESSYILTHRQQGVDWLSGHVLTSKPTSTVAYFFQRGYTYSSKTTPPNNPLSLGSIFFPVTPSPMLNTLRNAILC